MENNIRTLLARREKRRSGLSVHSKNQTRKEHEGEALPEMDLKCVLVWDWGVLFHKTEKLEGN